MEEQPAMATFFLHNQPLTPVSPLLPTSLPHVCESIPPLPMTPPDADEILDAASNEAGLQTGLHVIRTANGALEHLSDLLQSDSVAQEGFMNAVNTIVKTIHRGGKLVIVGVGKSGKIAKKVEATMNSLAIRSIFLHPTEALHGDMGIIAENDTLLMYTFSGRTHELELFLRHIPFHHPILMVTSHTHPSTCPLFANRPSSNCILLPAPIPVSETTSFGIPAPTTSTTVALVLSDALALAVSNRLHPKPADIFHKYHPGGAIGATAKQLGPRRMSDIAIQVLDIPIIQKHKRPSADYTSPTLIALDILLTAVRSPSGWVRLSSSAIIAPRQIQSLSQHLDVPVHALAHGMVVEKGDWISIQAGSTVEEAKEWIEQMRKSERGPAFLRPGTVLGVVDDKGEVSGVVEIEDVVDLGTDGDGDGDGGT